MACINCNIGIDYLINWLYNLNTSDTNTCIEICTDLIRQCEYVFP